MADNETPKPSTDEQYIQGIVLDPGYDSESGQWGYGYSSDNGVHFNVLNTIYGRKFRQEDADRLYPFLKKYFGNSSSGPIETSLHWADILNKPDLITKQQLDDRLAAFTPPSSAVSWDQITGKPDLATQADLDKIQLTPGPPGKDGQPGKDGADAYQLAVNNGFTGTVQDWLKSLQGKPGRDGVDGKGGQDGKPGRSAYQIAVDHGFNGSETEWLESLHGKDGATGPRGLQGPKSDTGPQGPAAEIPDTSNFATNSDLSDVRTTAESANSTASIAQETAQEAQNTASNASSTASSAYSLASSANSKASQLEKQISQIGKIDSSSQYTNKTPSQYADGVFYEIKNPDYIGIYRSDLDSSAQSGSTAIVTTKKYGQMARQAAEVLDNQRPITFIRNGYNSSWSSWEVVTTW